MELDFLTLADRVDALNGKLYMMGGCFSNLGLTVIPGPAQFDVALGILFDYHETGDRHQISLTLEDADNHPILGPLVVPLALDRPGSLPPGDQLRLVTAIRGPFVIPAEGLYHIAVELDGKRARPTRFRVQRVVPLVAQQLQPPT